MAGHDLMRKDQLEVSLHNEKKLIEEGVLKEDNPLDLSDNFRRLCEASRRGDLKVCQEMIQEGVNINAKDNYDYTPLILASLCGHYETVQLLLESGALCERDTFQGERCLYNALNDKIRNLLLSYDYSKSTDPLQPLASHLTSLLYRSQPKISDIVVSSNTESDSFNLHKFILAARSPYFRKKLEAAPETVAWKLPSSIPGPSFGIALKHLYLGELPKELGGGPGTGFSDSEILAGVDKISKHLEIKNLSEVILGNSDRRLMRQRRQDDVQYGVSQIGAWFQNNVVYHAVQTDTSRADDVKWDRNNGVFADILLRADEDEADEADAEIAFNKVAKGETVSTNVLGIPLGGSAQQSRSTSRTRRAYKEAQDKPHLQIITIDCSPAVLEIILTFLYTERVEFGLEIAIDVLFAADMLFLEKLKTKAAVIISTLGNGTATGMQTEVQTDDIDLDIYEILRAAWTTRVQRLEEFAARYIAYRLEQYIDEPAFADIVKESANRIQARQETDTIEILDDIKYYLSERFRLRFEDTGFDEAMAAQEQAEQEALAAQDSNVNGQPVPVSKGVPTDEGVDMSSPPREVEERTEAMMQEGVIRTLDGDIAGDEFEQDAMNYNILLGKIDGLLENLKLDA
ncbi:hypothetical protein LTR70_002057 [Exophiala xenobiotica]|uniref:BTB domain-containing protein n=1 Tax=Lithohypha guttulata TaxID=1690604 RepID=A0ABR0KBM0_9EURO|nr:hypothetical protein LTR24_004618 [Lithohypha guttulata]KAK5326293.1 hypothetical protein LTR70_002057 [Exophiala xenobiotica]